LGLLVLRNVGEDHGGQAGESERTECVHEWFSFGTTHPEAGASAATMTSSRNPGLSDLANQPVFSGDVPLDYVQCVNRAMDHVTRNLGSSLRLEEIARAAGFSPFHFHRVFKCLTGET